MSGPKDNFNWRNLLLGRSRKFAKLVDEDEALLRDAMRQTRKRLRRGRNTTLSGTATKKQRDRFARRKARELKKRVTGQPAYRLDIIDKSRLASHYQSNTILEHLHKGRKRDWLPISKRVRVLPYPSISIKDFSFLDNPDQTLNIFENLSRMEAQEISANIHFDDAYIEDIGSFLVLSEIWPAIRSFAEGGRMSLPIQRVLLEMGMGSELSIRLSGAEKESVRRNIWTMPVQRRTPLKKRSIEALIVPQTSDIAASRFGELVNEWLTVDNLQAELTPKGLGKLKSIFGELLDNAVRHSQPGQIEGSWSMAAFMARRDTETGPQFVCRIAVLSPGQSIADTFQGAAPSIKEFASEYAKTHRNERQSEDTLKTLLALQDTITTDPEAYAEEGGGTGLMETLTFFNALAALDSPGVAPKMTIVSGSSCVMLRPPYIVGQTDPDWIKDTAAPRRLWCNESNTRKIAPDPDYVFDLKRHLAGTLITMGFTLDTEWIKTVLENASGE